MPRLALIIQLSHRAVSQKDCSVVDLESTEAAIKLTEYFRDHVVKVLRHVSTKKQISTFDAVLSWIERQEGPVTVRSLQRSGILAVKKVEGATHFFNLIAEEGYGTIQEVKPVNGGTPYKVLKLRSTPDT